MNDRIHLHMNSTVSGTVRHLPSSKSLSNRGLIINALIGGKGNLENLSEARDTRLMEELLHTPGEVIDVKDAGTVMRFLTAYFAMTGQKKVITGTQRMQERPIANLVDALRTIGAQVGYLGKEGFPPLSLQGFAGQQANRVSIRGDISSQFISALMMLAPKLPNGLTIQLEGKVASRPYLTMTAELMRVFGVHAEVGKALIKVPAGNYKPTSYRVEADWSAASYWFAFAALAEKTDLLLPEVGSGSLQGDRVIVDIMKKLGVSSVFTPEGLKLTGRGQCVSHLEVNFSDCPDLAQTVLPVCAALGVTGEFKGMESLRIKETDRIAALRTELAKIGASLKEDSGIWKLAPGKPGDIPANLSINTYHDHRMAMGFASWTIQTDVEIENPDVVQKSYPGFWEDMKGLGFSIEATTS